MINQYEIVDVEYAANKFRDLLSKIPAEEVEIWQELPCTKALLWAIIHSEMSHLDNWRNGRFTHPSAAGTAQQNSEALGVLKALNLVKDFILEEMKSDDYRDRP